MTQHKSAIVVGAGIVGLATARALSLKGYAVTIIDRSERAVGASIRNFGMLWPIGQPDGKLYNRAMRSKTIWKEVCDSTGLWCDEVGSLHVAHHEDEWQVLQELHAAFTQTGRPVELLNKSTISNRFNQVNEQGLLGGLYSPTETIVDPRVAIATVADYLKEYLNVTFIWGKAVTEVTTSKLKAGNDTYEADVICICSGADFETLYPQQFQQLAITKCKLQMLRFASASATRMGVSLCGGLSLIHYNSFKVAPSLANLKNRYETEMADYLKWGIHVMVSQNDKGELTIGDSHEYGLTFDPFDKSFINKLVLDYLNEFAITKDWQLVQSWHGIYPKMTNGDTDVFLQPETNVFIINGLGGAGMTLSFGFAEECVQKIC